MFVKTKPCILIIPETSDDDLEGILRQIVYNQISCYENMSVSYEYIHCIVSHWDIVLSMSHTLYIHVFGKEILIYFRSRQAFGLPSPQTSDYIHMVHTCLLRSLRYRYIWFVFIIICYCSADVFKLLHFYMLSSVKLYDAISCMCDNVQMF